MDGVTSARVTQTLGSRRNLLSTTKPVPLLPWPLPSLSAPGAPGGLQRGPRRVNDASRLHRSGFNSLPAALCSTDSVAHNMS